MPETVLTAIQPCRCSARSAALSAGAPTISCRCSEWQAADAVHPFFSLARRPDEDDLLDHIGDGKVLWNHHDAGACAGSQELGEVLRHRPAIVGDQNPACSCRSRQDFNIGQTGKSRLEGAQEVDDRFPADRGQEDLPVEIGVGLKADPHDLCWLAAASFS
jgi:hypothetical protein